MLFARTPEETTGHGLLDQYADIVARAQAEIEALAGEAAERQSVVEARLKELEAEKLVLNQLAGDPKVLVARGPVVGPLPFEEVGADEV